MAVYYQLECAKYFKISRALFTEEDGAPIKFYFKEKCPDLETVIHKGSGELTDSPSKASILLCEKESANLAAQDYVKLEYVVDCVKKNTLLDVDKYRAWSLGTMPSLPAKNRSSVSHAPEKPAAEGEGSLSDVAGSDSEESFWKPSSNISVRSSALAGRSKYSDEEDFRIIRHIIVHKKHNKTGGNLLWKQMESLKVTSHSHQSMKARFKKKILPEIDSYDIPDKWKTLLSNGDSDSKTNSLSPFKRHERSESPIIDLTFESLEAWKHKERQKRGAREQPADENKDRIDQFPEEDDLNTQDLDELDRMILSHAHNDKPTEQESTQTKASSPDQLDRPGPSGMSTHPRLHSSTPVQSQAQPAKRSKTKRKNVLDSSSDESAGVSKDFTLRVLSKCLTSQTLMAQQQKRPRRHLPEAETNSNTEESLDFRIAKRRVQVMRKLYGMTEAQAVRLLLKHQGNFQTALMFLEMNL